MKIGVYFACHRNPLFFRMTMLQLAQQTKLPDVIAIHQNNTDLPFSWAAEDVIKRLMTQGMKFEAKFTRGPIHHPNFHIWPLRKLIENDCDVYLKVDHDDFIYDNHIESLVSNLGGYDMVINKKAAYLTLPFMDDYRYDKEVDFSRINPLGGMSDACCFTKKFAEQYLKDMEEADLGSADDVIMIGTKAKFKTLQIDVKPTACWISHWTNDSSATLVADQYAFTRGFVDKRVVDELEEKIEGLEIELNSLKAMESSALHYEK